MAAAGLHDLDGFIPLLSSTDIRMKVNVGCKLFTYLEESSNSIECSDIGMFIDGIVQWLLNSNPKVALYGIEIITQLINRMRIDFRPYISTILPLAVDRIGDSKEPIKVKTLFLIMKLMECNTISPQALFDKISVNAFNHKNSNVKEGSMKLLLLTIEEFGANCIAISKILPMIIKLLSDPNVQVRQKAFETLVDLYKHVGEKLRVDIQKKYSIPQSKMTDLMNKFDEAKATGSLLPTAFVGLSLSNNDETDRSCTFGPKYVIGSIKRPSSFPKSNLTTPLQQVDFVRKSTSSSALSASHTGGVDEDTFIRAFEDVPILQIFSVRDLDDTMKKIHESIQDSNELWNKRVDSLKKVRSLVLIGATKYEEFYNNLRYLEHSFQISIKDLRSQVIRETCITIAFLSQHLGTKFNHFSESIFGNLIDLIQNSAKVTASSGLVAIRFILEYSHAPRIIPILANSLGSKSKDIRRACCEFFDQILRTWPTQAIERHLTILQDCIRKGIADADSNARVISRKAFWGFCEHFPEHGEILLNKLEPAYRKILLTNSVSNLGLSKSVIAESTKLTSYRPVSSRSNISVRSRSAIDLQATKRSNAHTEYALFPRQKVDAELSFQSVTKKTNEDIHQTDKRERSRVQVSSSQPASRSGSPSSKLNFIKTKSNKVASGIPRSRSTSREVSPNRINNNGSYMNNKELHNLFTPRPIRTQKILTQTQEPKSTNTDTLSYKNVNNSPRKVLGGLFNDYSDESETSSVGSERRIDSHKRFSDSFYLNGSACGLHKEIWKSSGLKYLNIDDIITNCESSCWNNRKEGLISLLKYFQQGNILSELLLMKITELFTKMFMDSQTKVISLFLDVLNELIVTHSQYLEYWLYTVLVKLFIKGGSDILGSVLSKILKTLEIIRLSFPCDSQLTAVFKFLTDPTQTPNVKIKIFAMSYISKLAVCANSGSIFVSAVNGKKDYATLALIKMIGWTMCNNNITQGPELRRASQEAILALYNLNASQITLRLSQLPEEYQEVFSKLLKLRVRRSSVDPIMSLNYHNSQVPSNLASPPLQPDTIDTFNSEKIHKSFQQSADNVQNCRLKCHYSEEINANFCEFRHNQLFIHTETNSGHLNGYNNSHTTVNGILQILDDLDKDTLQLDHKQSILIHLKELIKNEFSSGELIQNFKKMINVILKLLMDIEPIVREHTITLITCLLKKSELVTHFHNYTESIILKVINMCCDSYKPIVKVAEDCLITLSVSLHHETVVKIITPLMLVKEFPINLITIRMMTKLVDMYGSPPVTDQIKDIMFGLLQSYDNPDSAVRKSAVFCMVSLYRAFGSQEFTPHIASLNGAKLKLLNLYIERAQQTIKIN
ncbi:PREDICTED: CLIP-associating protein 1-like [Diuraphis noxia]|uniref:CLIP-associating protein 1-like n=1 Tax=Diuraphis noxia TaxID=143948 RepID=UPI000763B199|nr:PREDICTED: CLIP-associating protein 1-like [Diuraphis noxia]